MTIDMTKSEERLNQFCKWVGVKKPETLLADDRAPSSELIDFCKAEDCSLDWIFSGDLEALFRSGRKSTSQQMKTRVNQVARIYGTEPFHLETDEKGEVLLCDGLIEWATSNGLCLNWLFEGGTDRLVKTYANEKKQERRLLKLAKAMTEEELKIYTFAIKSVVDGTASMEDAMSSFKESLAEHRAAA